MKLHPEAPCLSAYILGELEHDEALSVEHSIAEDPDLQNALLELEDAGKFLTDSLDPQANKLLPQQRAEIIAAARQAALSDPRAPSDTNWKPSLVWIAAAAAVFVTIVTVSKIPKPRPPTITSQPVPVKTTIAPVITQTVEPKAIVENTAPTVPPAMTPPAVPPAEKEMPYSQAIASTSVADRPALELPILSAKPNLDSIIQSVRVERKLPDHESVRLQEILNSFPIRLNGVTAIARSAKQTWHPDNRDDGVTTHTATLATETLACPWKPSATLILVSIRGNAMNDCEAKVIFRPNPATVAHYRLLGYTDNSGSPTEKLPTSLPAKSATTLAIEVEPSTAKGDFGIIEWSVNNEAAASITLARNAAVEPSNDARFGALICAYAQWLAGEQPGIIDADLLSAFAREIASSELPAERTDFIKLMDESLALQAR